MPHKGSSFSTNMDASKGSYSSIKGHRQSRIHHVSSDGMHFRRSIVHDNYRSWIDNEVVARIRLKYRSTINQ
jgi:hypothetical protein